MGIEKRTLGMSFERPVFETVFFSLGMHRWLLADKSVAENNSVYSVESCVYMKSRKNPDLKILGDLQTGKIRRLLNIR